MDGCALFRFRCRDPRPSLIALLLLAGCAAQQPESADTEVTLRLRPPDPRGAPPHAENSASRARQDATVGESDPASTRQDSRLATDHPPLFGGDRDPGRTSWREARARGQLPASYSAPREERRAHSADTPEDSPPSTDRLRRSVPAPRPRLLPRAHRPLRPPPPAPRKRESTSVQQLPFQDYVELVPYLEGVASWYGPTFHGKKTASGETYDQFGITAAHPVLPMNTRVWVENRENGKRVYLRINDRGPYKKGRILDLSKSAARRLGVLEKGTAHVRITIARWPNNMDPSEGLRAYRQFVVQVVAFPDEARAEAQRRTLIDRFDHLPFLLDRTAKGLYAVIAGPFDAEHDARRASLSLQKSGITNLVRSYRK